MNQQSLPISPWRWPVATALCATAAIHLALVPAHLREAPYAGGLFLAQATAAVALALVLLIRCDPRAWLACAGLAAMAAGAYVISRSVGLPAMADDVGDWLNPLGLAAVTCELAVVAIAGRVLWHRRGPTPASFASDAIA